jgi:hypothetical protein
MHFDTKSYLKSTRNHTAKQTVSSRLILTHTHLSFFANILSKWEFDFYFYFTLFKIDSKF